MKTHIELPEELFAEIDFNNTLNGGRAEPKVTSRTTHNCSYLMLKIPNIDPQRVKVQIVNRRLMVFIPFTVHNEAKHIKHYFVNMPLSPDVDIPKISAQWGTDGRLHIKAPFTNEWKYGNPNDTFVKEN